MNLQHWSFNRAVSGILLLVILILACAEIQPPPGGQPDRTPPAIDSTIPARGATSVAPGNQITVYFSERVQAGTGRQVFISPRPASDPELTWRSDRLVITLPEDFQPGHTYVISFTSAITDLRNNRLDSAMAIAFTMDSVLDSGSIAGQIFQAGKGQPGVLVGLYAIDTAAGILYDSTYPDYLAQTNREGEFTFQYLPTREFRLIAFTDKNADERFNPLREAFAVPDRPVVVGGELPLDQLAMHMTSADTTRPEILSVVHTASNLVRIRFSREIALDYLKGNLAQVSLVPIADSTRHIPALAMQEGDLEKSSSLTFWFGSVPPGDYRVLLQPSAETGSVRFEQLQIKEISDNEPPTVVRNTPGSRPMFAADIRLSIVFSEPVDTTRLTPQTFVLTRLSSDTAAVTLQKTWLSPFQLTLVPDTLVSGVNYQLDVTEFEIFDIAGNALGDSLITFIFGTLNADSLGSISGTVTIELQDKTADPVVLHVREVANKFSDTLVVQGGAFSASVPAGRYILSGFIDSNRDGKFSEGSIEPWRLSETAAEYTDTVVVRARFETAEIDFRIR